MNKVLLLCLAFFACLRVFANDSILVDKVWTERRTILYDKEEMDTIGEDSLIEDCGIACGYSGCEEMVFYGNHQFKKKYPDGKVRIGKWNLTDDILTITYDKREKRRKKYRFKIKYRVKKECPTLYLFEIKGCVYYIVCNYD